MSGPPTTARTAGRRRRLLPALVIAASTLLSLGAAELVVRATWTRSLAKSRPPLSPELRSLPELHGVAALTGRNQRGVFNRVLYETNSAGFRGRDYSLVKLNGVFRIVAIGDSITMGSGIWVDEAYPAVTERMLNQMDRDLYYEVLNLGIAGLNARASVRNRLERIGLPFDPDMIVYGFTLNDIQNDAYREIERVMPGSSDPDQKGSQLWRLLQARWEYLRELVYPVAGSYVHELDENYFNNPEAWSGLLAELDHLAAIGARIDACVVVLLHTQLHGLHAYHPFKRHYDAVARAAEERGMYVIESLPAFSGMSGPALWVGRYDPHPNARGHEILAQTLYDGLLALPDSCGLMGDAHHASTAR